MSRVKNTVKSNNLVVIYTRVSTQEQGKSGLGLEAQLAACQGIVNALGLEVVGCYRDIVSGSSDPMLRDGFKAATDKAIEYGARMLIAKLDRLARDTFYISSFLNGYTIRNCPGVICADSPTATPLELGIKAVLSEEERRLISKRTREALAAKRERGYTDFGKAGRQAHSDKAQDATKDAIARAFELRDAGTSLDKICEILNDEGFTTSRGSAWKKSTLYSRFEALKAA